MQNLTLVVSVFNDKYCDLYFFTPGQINLLVENTHFLSDAMEYVFYSKRNGAESSLECIFREYLNNQFSRKDLNIKSYLDMPQAYSVEPILAIGDYKLKDVFVCDFCTASYYDVEKDTLFDCRQRPKLYKSESVEYDDGCIYNLAKENLDDLISTVRRCSDELNSFNDLSLYSVKDDREIEVCSFSIGNEGYFIQKAREHADNDNFLRHRTYVYEYNHGKLNKIYGCVKPEKYSNVIALDLKEDSQFSIDEKEQSIQLDRLYDPFKTNAYELYVDNNDHLKKTCVSVELSYKSVDGDKIIARFYYTKNTAQYFYSDDSFQLGSEHKIILRLHSPNADETHYLVEDDLFTLKEKRICLCNESDTLCFEFVFAKEADHYCQKP